MFILTDNAEAKEEYKTLLQTAKNNVLTFSDYISANKTQYPELENYLGFNDLSAELLLKSKDNFYEPHLSQADMLVGIREGRYFHGRLNVSRVTNTEATVSVSNMNKDLLIETPISMNRALNGDIVCVEILPEDQWSTSYRSGAPIDIIEKEEDSHVAELSLEDNTTDKTIVEKVNAEKKKKVTAKVRGIVKTMSKTYGGSLLDPVEMTTSTKQKVESVFDNYGLSAAQARNYRLFVPFNVQLPFVLVKSNNIKALEGKRIIVRIDKWETGSYFPQGKFVKVVGEDGATKSETAVILHEYNVDTRPFTQKVLACLPNDGENWQPTEAELATRRDFRNLPVCSVDPPGCKDIDDALHCVKLPNGNY